MSDDAAVELSALELTVDVPVDEVLAYEVRLTADGTVTWTREASDGVDETVRRCVETGRADLVEPWLARAGEAAASVALAPADGEDDPEVLAAYNEGGARYWLTFERRGGEGVVQRLAPRGAVDYRTTRELALELWTALEPQAPDFERDCEAVDEPG